MKYAVLSDELKSLRNRKGEEIFYEEAATGNAAYRAPRGDDGKALHTTSGMTADEKKGHYVYRDGLLSYETMDAFKEGRKEKRQNSAATSTSKSGTTKPVSEKKLDVTLEKVRQAFAGIVASADPVTAVAPFASLERYLEARPSLPTEVADVIETNLDEFTATTLVQVKDFFTKVIDDAMECLKSVDYIEQKLRG